FAHGKLQPLITQTLLPGTRKVYEQLLSRDFNPRDTPPMTACGQTRFIGVRKNRHRPSTAATC
ncbi:MAG: hypothetical protein VST67_13010, partial [Nitrospirota bacterium]|nr:hypothetical protein [Nitrospirota bacterium]